MASTAWRLANHKARELGWIEGKRYRATLALDSVEQLVDNALIAEKFSALGFSKVRVSGTGATRRVEGVWPRKDATARVTRRRA